MTHLYNCKTSGDQYKITKFDDQFNVESSYLCTETECQCPAGHRPSCRHRQMLPKFLHRGYVDSMFFYDHDRGGWVQGWKEEPSPILEQLETSNINLQVGDVIHVRLGRGMTDDEASEMLKQPNEFADKILEETDRMERAMQERYGVASEALPIQQEPTAEQKANMAFSLAGGTITTEYKTDGSVNTFKTIDHEPSLAPEGLGQASEQTPSPYDAFDYTTRSEIEPVKPSPPPTIRRRV